MKLTANTTTFEAAPAGVHIARLFRIVDLGTQTSDYQGKPTASRKLLMTFELLGEDRMSDGRPYTISRRFTASLSDKAALRAFIEQWRGRRFTDAELAEGFEVSRLLGQYGLLNLTETERNGNAYTNIANISPLPKGMPKPEGVNAAVIFDLDQPDWDVFDGLSERLKEQIAASPEYQAIPSLQAPQKPSKADASGFEADDIPF